MASRLALLCLLAACGRTTLHSSVADRHGGADPMQEMDFWDGLALQPAVSNRDALHALLLSFGGSGGAKGYDAEAARAKERGWIDEQPPANETARVGWIAAVVCREAGIEGGATMRVFGANGRYAVRELNHMGWLGDMTPSQSLSGSQLIAVLSRAEERRKGTGGLGPKEDM
jgi:hypothetical protein